MAKKKTFSKLKNHLKSTELNEKLSMLDEDMPRNNTAFVFQGDPSNPQGNSFETITDGETDETDYNIGENPTNSTEARDTTGLFNAGGVHADGKYVKTEEPPGDTSYVLGPMAAMYYTWSYPWTMVGYIRESDRRMVNLGRIDGKLSDWDGSSGSGGSGTGTFYSYGQLTTEQALWFRDIKKANGNTNDPATYSYRAFYPGPPSATPDAYGRYPCILTGVSKKEPREVPDATPLDKQAGDNFSAMLDKIKKGLRNFGDSFDKNVEDGIDQLKDFLGDKFDDVMDGVIENLGKITRMESSANMLNKYDDFLKKNPNGSDERIDVTNEFSDRDLNALNDVRNDPIVNDAIKKALEVQNNPDRANKPLAQKPPNSDATTVGELMWDLAKDAVTKGLQDKVYDRPGLDNSIHNNVQIDFEDFKNSNGQNWTIEKNYEFRPGGSVEGAEDTPLGAALTAAGIELDSLGAGSIPVVVGGVIAAKTGITGANQHGGLYNSPTMKYKVKVPNSKIKINQGGQGGRPLGSTTNRGGMEEGLSLERKREIFGHLTQPVILPETKQKTYKVSPGQRYKDKNKKPETNFQDMDKLFNKNIGGPQPFKPQERTSWTKDFINHNVIQSQEKMNGVLELIGNGKHAFGHALNDYKKMGAKELEQYWGKNPNMYSFLFNGKKYNVTRKEHIEGDSIVFMEDQHGVKSNMLQSKINEILQEENEKWINEAYFKSHPVIPKKEESTYELIKRRFLENKKIAPEFPAESPPKMINGFHPEYGKKANRYKKLDPASANSMPPTGDPEIDAVVNKQKTINKIKRMAKNK
jgi:hypothetical protein